MQKYLRAGPTEKLLRCAVFGKPKLIAVKRKSVHNKESREILQRKKGNGYVNKNVFGYVLNQKRISHAEVSKGWPH